ncbi:PWWP domain [Arabidopsis thaliana x Arabidopsis arenosa]|uniref:PWWP domain n=1 Tax=Arabidopsis thaliana x Arabidopsis arenosa TaxID=1240361 RepID=A0A8T1Z004_9BRAS|nr:PWWP domain [Arabidopsis thaliana x Arabidopsis arenosa]
MNEDAEIVPQTDSIQDPKVTPGDTVLDSNGDGHEAIDNDDDVAASSPMELDSAVRNDDGDVRVSESERSEKNGVVGSEEEDDISETKSEDILIDKDIDSSEHKEEEEEEDGSDDQSSELGSEADEKDLDLKEEKIGVSDYKSLLSEFDDYVASEKMGSGVSRALSYGFEVGDLVWGKVKSHPWWPGHIFNEAFASPSVRRMRRIDHVLVAFFGDSSYGWFDPAELIPFEPNLEEKSQQTVSKHFVRAVEEAMDEASRRSALGLTCKCRNPYNFRPTNVEDYFAVDVPDYELQAVYSADQIKNSRDKFLPVETLSFVKQLALAPQECDPDSLKFMKKKAVVFSFRKAVFEEFDETYAQAFGTKSARSSVSSHESHNRAPPRAPLSGPLVIAETLGDLKSSKKPKKVKDSKKKDKYLLKGRDEAGDKSVQFGQIEASSLTSHIQGIDGSLDGDFVLQRRAPMLQTPVKDEQSGIVGIDFASSSAAIPGKECSVPMLSLDEEKGLAEESKEKMEERSDVLPEHGKSEAMASRKEEAGTDLGSAESSLQPLLESHTSASEGKSSTGSVIKKVKVSKRSSSEMGSEDPPSEPKKKKKKKKEHDSDHAVKRKFLSSGEAGAKKLSQLGSMHLQSYMEVDVPQLLSHLQDLSLDPFHGSSVTSFGAARKFFLRFRSLNYQKSLSVSSSDATVENARDTKPSKPVKTVKRTEDPSKAGKKRLSSDRQDDIPSAKKLKKTNQLKSMTSEKKISREAKDSIKPVREQSSAVQAKAARAQTGKKTAPSVKVVEPTMLVMKFPPGTSLPSAALLKARFGRFGLLDQSAIRVFWKSSTCRVVFLYKADAQTAFRYATGNNTLFGNVNVKYFLRDVDAPKAEPREPENTKEDDEPQSQWLDQAPPLHQPTLPPPNVNLKSCLKKPVDDPSSSSNNGNGNRATVRVKFMLGGEENSSKATTEPPPVTTISNRNSGPSSSSSSVAMEFVSKKFQNVVHHQQLPPSTLPPILPLPPQYTKPQQHPIKPVDHVEPPLPPSRNFRGPNPAVSAGDISHQMLNLLSKCNEVVANVTGLLGYVPYHPL